MTADPRDPATWRNEPTHAGWWWCCIRKGAPPELVHVSGRGGHNGRLGGVRMNAVLKPKPDRRAYPVDMVDSPFEDAVWCPVAPPPTPITPANLRAEGEA